MAWGSLTNKRDLSELPDIYTDDVMDKRPNLSVYLHKQLRQRAQSGDQNFLNLVKDVVEDAGIQVRFKSDELGERFRTLSRNEYALFHMQEPLNEYGLTFRKVYMFPFWEIERTNERWNWETAQASFSSIDIDEASSNWFFNHWRKQLFGEQELRKDGYVYVPLQGVLLKKRSFQNASPVEMVKRLAKIETKRPIYVTLHPNETYSKVELDKLHDVINTFDHVELSETHSDDLLRHCDYVVSQNSSVAFKGYFLKKPAILFADIDFHHIALNISKLSLETAVEMVENHSPDYEKYMFWFLQERAINAGRDFAKDKIRARLRHFGWDV